MTFDLAAAAYVFRRDCVIMSDCSDPVAAKPRKSRESTKEEKRKNFAINML